MMKEAKKLSMSPIQSSSTSSTLDFPSEKVSLGLRLRSDGKGMSFQAARGILRSSVSPKASPKDERAGVSSIVGRDEPPVPAKTFPYRHHAREASRRVSADWIGLGLRLEKLRLGLLAFIILLSCAAVAFAAEGKKPIVPPEIGEIKIPEELGRIVEYHQGSKPLNIFYIQDAHVNIEAQKAIAKIIEILHKKKDIRLVLVEGGIGDVSLTEYRVGHKEKRQTIAEDLLREGKISGEEYLNFVEDYPIQLWGIESQVLYDENLIAYTKVEPIMPETLKKIQQTVQAIGRIKPKVYPASYLEFETKLDELAAKNDLHHEAKLLLDQAEKQKIGMDEFPNIKVLASLIALEAGADFEKTDYERGQLVRALQRKATGKELRELLDFESTVKNDHEKRAQFYEKLLALAGKNQIDLNAYPALRSAPSYLRQQDKIDSIAFFSEKQKLEEKIAAAVLTAEPAAKLYRISRDAKRLEALVKLEMLPDDYQIFMNDRDRFRIELWGSFLKEHGADLPSDLKKLDETIDEFQSFYRIANIRDQALVENLTEKIKDAREPESILIAGGFHKDRLVRKLLRIGFNVIVISPAVGLNQGPELYRKMLKEKWEGGRWYIKDQ